MVSKNVMNSILLRANDLPENVKEILKESKHGRLLLKIFKQLVARCFLTLSNLVDCMTVSQLGGCDTVIQSTRLLSVRKHLATNCLKFLRRSRPCFDSVRISLTFSGRSLARNRIELMTFLDTIISASFGWMFALFWIDVKSSSSSSS